MTTSHLDAHSLATPLGWRVGRAINVFRKRLRDPYFWLVQAVILAVTVLHYGFELSGEPADISSVHHIPVTLYLIAVLFAGIHYGREGGILTAVWVIVLTMPSIAIWHRDSFMWIGETAQLVVSLTVGAVVAWRVELEMRHRRQAEAASQRVALLHQVSSAVNSTLELEHVLGKALALIAEGLQSDRAWVSVWEGRDEPPALLAEFGEAIRAEAGGDCDGFAWQQVSKDVQTTGSSAAYGDTTIGAPLIAEGKLIGALGVGCRRGQTYSADDSDLLAAIANQVAVALDNARLYRDELRLRHSLREYASQVTRAHEEERKRISRELHDGVLQDLIGVTREIDSIVGRMGARANGLQDQLEAIRSVTQTIRRFSRDLRPSILDDLGLIPALEWLASDLSTRAGIAASVLVDGQARRLAPEHELLVFRIAQEALRNVEKHASASEVSVNVLFTADAAEMRVTDNGRGFRVPRLQDGVYSGKLGLLGMRERANLMGASYEVESRPGRGTRVTVRVPTTHHAPGAVPASSDAEDQAADL